MAEPTDTENKALVPSAEAQPPAVLSGIQKRFLGGEIHAGVAIDVTAIGGASTLMIPDVMGVSNGDSPVFITKPISVEGAKFKAFLTNKGIPLPDQAGRLLSDLKISLNAFFFTNNQYVMVKDPADNTGKKLIRKTPEEIAKKGPILMSFSITSDKGIISALTGDDSFKEIFDITGASLRVLRCQEEDFPVLQAYARELTS